MLISIHKLKLKLNNVLAEKFFWIMIVIESKRRKRENILKKYTDAVIANAIIYDKKNEKPIRLINVKRIIFV